MDEVRVFDYALTAAEIEAVFSGDAHCMEVYPEHIDQNWDCVIDLTDILPLLEYWMNSGLYSPGESVQ